MIIKRVFKKLRFEYVNLLYLALSRTFNLQIIKLFLNLHSIFYFLFFSRLLVRILNSSMPTIEMRSMLMNAEFNYLFRAYTSMTVFFFNILFTDSEFAIKCVGPQITSSNGIVYERDNETLGPATNYVVDTERWAVSNVGYFSGSNNA